MAAKRKDRNGRVLKKGEQCRENNLYMYRWTDFRGERKCIYASTLEDLRKKEEEINKENIVGVSRTSDTLNDQIDLYLMTKVNLANSTLENYKYYYNHCIKDSVLGKKKLINIRKSDILVFYQSLFKKGFSIGTIKIIHKIIHPALQLACDDDLIMKNPAIGCTKEYKDEMEKKYALTFEEEKEFLERINLRPRMRRYYPLYSILLNTGLRISEAIGLTWDDVDMNKKEININHQIQYRKMNGKTQLYANETKTNAGKRVMPMSDETYQLFLEQKKVWLQSKKNNDFEVDGYKNFVFLSHVTGKCLNHNSVRRMMKTIVGMNDEREVKLPNISPHILRHTMCCRLAESGCDIKVIQYLIGHTDLRTTMQVYNHIDITRVRREMNKIKCLHQSTPIFTPISSKSM